jgi:hypothetical protein
MDKDTHTANVNQACKRLLKVWQVAHLVLSKQPPLFTSFQLAVHSMPALQVLSVRHRGGGKLLLPVTALPHGLTVLALKKVMIYCNSSSSGSSSCAAAIEILQQQQQHDGQGGGDVGVEDGSESEGAAACDLSHALTSPGFTRAALTNSISSPDLTTLAARSIPAGDSAAAAAAASAGGSGASGGANGVRVCSTPPVLLPNLRRLYLKLCLVPAAALTAMLGLPPPTSSSSSIQPSGQQRQQGPAGPPRTGCFTRGGGDSGSSSRSSSSCSGRAVCFVRPPLEVLSVTGDGAARGEACEAWARWLDALKHLQALQVGVRSMKTHVSSDPSILTILV